MSLIRSLAIGALLATVAVSGANAYTTTLFSNAGVPSGDNRTLDTNLTGPLAQSFTTDANTTSLSSLSLDLKLSTADTTGSFTVTLYNDVANTVSGAGVVLGTILDSNLSVTPGMVSVSGVSGTTLLANTSYFVVLSDATTAVASNAEWLIAQNGTGTGTTGQVGQYSSAANYDSVTSYPFIMTVVSNESGAAPAPEPATLALMGVGLAGLGFVRSRRNARKA